MAGDDEDVEAAIMRKMVIGRTPTLSASVPSFSHTVACHSFFITLCSQGMPMSFDSSHNKKVEGNYAGLVKRDTKRSARQYMNRIGDECSLTS
jgi:hypothetical protein